MIDVKLCAFADEAADDLAGQIDMMKNGGIEYLEMRAVDKKNVSLFSDEEAREYRKRLDDAGIKVWSLGSPIGKVEITAPFSEEIDRLKRTLEIADITGAKRIRMFSFYGTNGEAAYRDEVMERLSRFADAAKGSGVVLCHENEKGIYGDSADHCLDIYKSVPEIRGVFDPANFVQVGEDTLRAWDMLADYIDYGHIKDSLADGSIVPPGKGIGHIAEYLPKFFAKGLQVLTLEPHLMEFASLAAIERAGEESKVGLYHFDSRRQAFDYAIAALKEIIGGIEV